MRGGRLIKRGRVDKYLNALDSLESLDNFVVSVWYNTFNIYSDVKKMNTQWEKKKEVIGYYYTKVF